MGLFLRFKEDWIFIGLLLLGACVGTVGGLYLPWYSIMGLSFIGAIVWMGAIITLDRTSTGMTNIVILSVIPIMLVFCWVIFWLSFGIR